MAFGSCRTDIVFQYAHLQSEIYFSLFSPEIIFYFQNHVIAVTNRLSSVAGKKTQNHYNQR